MGAASSKAASQAGPSNVCINLCNTFARTRFAIVPLEAGVHDGWMELLKWSGGTRVGLETVQTRICQFLQAWASVLYMRGDYTGGVYGCRPTGPNVQEGVRLGALRCSVHPTCMYP